METGTSGTEARRPEHVSVNPDEVAPYSGAMPDYTGGSEATDEKSMSTQELCEPIKHAKHDDAGFGLRFGEKMVAGVVQPRPKNPNSKRW